MERINYSIVSKIKKADGTPEFVKYGTSADINYTIRFHQYHLARNSHPDPQMRLYAISHGWNCFEYIIDPVEQKIIEQAVIKPAKEVRSKKVV